jgi:energy-coupling factor transporter ATP-binding protein EcfA2
LSSYIIDPKVVAEHLTKPYDLKEAWDRANLHGNSPESGQNFYTDKELRAVESELTRIYNELSEGLKPVTSRKKKFFLSAGAPGSGKSTLLENLITKNKTFQQMVFSDPDERALKLMEVYKNDIEKFGGGLVGLTLAYTKWRWASNYISGTIMNKACEDQYDILHGTTATSPFVSLLYDNAHEENYDITTFIVCAPDDVRVKSAHKRFKVEQTRYTHDTKEKGAMFYERVPTLFKKTDNFKLYWRNAVNAAPVLAATGGHGKIRVMNQEALNDIEKDIKQHVDLSWNDLNNIYTSKLKP